MAEDRLREFAEGGYVTPKGGRACLGFPDEMEEAHIPESEQPPALKVEEVPEDTVEMLQKWMDDHTMTLP